MVKLLKYLEKKDWLIMLLIVILVISQVWLELKLPDYMSEITRLVQTEGSQMVEILKNGGYMLLCAFGSLIAAIITGYLVSKLASKFSMTM